jgi:serine/threonine-protein kinase
MTPRDGEGSLARRMFRAHFAEGAPAREIFYAQLYVAMALLSISVMTIFRSHRYAILHNVLPLLIVIGYHAALLLVLRRGWFHPAVPWVSMVVQTSLIGGAYADALLHNYGPSVLMPLPMAWSMIVAGSAMRGMPSLSAVAGALSATEMLALEWIIGRRAPNEIERVTVVQLFLTGILAAALAHYLLRQAERALRAVREQDLMGKYFLHERIGKGGMAEVYRATYSPEGGFEKQVAVKRVLPAISAVPEFVEMFREEAHLCALLAHPNVVQVLDAGRFKDTYILTMEFVDGASLGEVMRRRRAPLPLSVATYVASELAAALGYIHGRTTSEGAPLHLVHQDVNPPNVLLSRNAEVKLADFGVAHAATRSTVQEGRIFGKIAYLAPEQAAGGALDGKTDLFALGLTLYEMVVGARAFPAKTVEELHPLHHRSVPRASTVRPEIPAALDELIGALLSMQPSQRPGPDEVRERLGALGGAAAPRPSGPIELKRIVLETIAGRAEELSETLPGASSPPAARQATAATRVD